MICRNFYLNASMCVCRLSAKVDSETNYNYIAEKKTPPYRRQNIELNFTKKSEPINWLSVTHFTNSVKR